MTNHARVAEYFPNAYEGTVTFNGNEKTIIEVATYRELSPILRKYGEWVVTKDGVECLTRNYVIQRERLDEQDWHDHMSEKPWVNIDDFENALATAQDMVKLEII